MRIFSIVFLAALALAGCAPAPIIGADGKPVQQLYRIGPGETAEIQYRMLDAVNALRAANGAPALQLDSSLNAAAATHSRDMSVQNRPWHFGSDGSSPLERVARAGYDGRFLGENISETYETEIETLAAWMENPNTRNVILDSKAREMGFSFFQEPHGKIWWTLVTGTPEAPADVITGSRPAQG